MLQGKSLNPNHNLWGFCCFETGSNVAQAVLKLKTDVLNKDGLELLILLPTHSKSWDYRLVTPLPDFPV